MKLTYKNLMGKKASNGVYKCPICHDAKDYKPSGFALHLKAVHNITKKVKGKKVKKVHKVPYTHSVVKYCPNCGFPVGELDQAAVLLREK
jgi:DNA-directed RNA polymerase subunit M/transcription elongation factor TFIIS